MKAWGVFLLIFLHVIVFTVRGDMFCPQQQDFDYGGNIQWHGNGWTMSGSGGVHGLTAFNLLSGYVQFDMDTSAAQGGVNNNFYTSSPWKGLFPSYCDIQENDSPQCMEMDIVENNGNCLSQVTWHTWPNHNGDCDEAGCWGQAYASGSRTVKAEFSGDGNMVVSINGQVVDVSNPVPSNNAKAYVKQQTEDVGLQFHSSQWVGWVPAENSCPGGGWVDGSTFSISNLIVSGTVVQGKEPSRCQELDEQYYNSTMAALAHYQRLERKWKNATFGLRQN